LTDQANIKAQTAHDAVLLFQDIADVIRQAHQQVRQAVNTAMVQSYWQIGHLIVEHEQQGQQRAAYGKQQLQQLSKQLTAEFGKGFDASNLRNMRSFYLCFPKCDAVSHKLSWTHYRKLIRIENPKARAWYQQEAIEQRWSARALDRQINKLYYERILSSHDATSIALEAKEKINAIEAEPQLRPKDVLRDPYILDFLKLGKLTHQDVGQMDSADVKIDSDHLIGYDSPNNTPHAYQRCAPRGVTFFLAGNL